MSSFNSSTKFSRKGTFADLLVKFIGDRCGGDAPSVYNAACIDRRTYSSIVSNPFRNVSKRTAIQFALALGLSRSDSERLLMAAGYAFSPAIPEDVVVAGLIEDGEYDLFRVNKRLSEMGLRTM